MAAPNGCRHERAHVLDSAFHGHNYATTASRRIFCDHCRLRRWLHVEATLAACQAELGMIPALAAAEIERACAAYEIDAATLAPEFRLTGHSLVPLLRGVQATCAGDAGEFLHYGATTQDVQDTAQALEMRDVLDEAEALLAMAIECAANLAARHRDDLMVGRTHAQPALPMTFGIKAAGWADELLRQAGRLARARESVLVAQLFGGAGTMAGFDGRGRALLERFAERLGLAAPTTCWHAARDRVAEYGTTLAMAAATLARIADEVRTLSRVELREVEEGWEYGQVGSSTMPHKRNPESSEQVVVLARLARANAALTIECMSQEHERDARGLRMEWVAVADVSHHTLAALAIGVDVLRGLEVHPERMAAHAHDVAEAICSEAVMLAFGKRIGKQSAHTLVYDVSQHAQSNGGSLRAALHERSDVAEWLPPDELDALFDPGQYLGECGDIVDRTVERAQKWLANR